MLCIFPPFVLCNNSECSFHCWLLIILIWLQLLDVCSLGNSYTVDLSTCVFLCMFVCSAFRSLMDLSRCPSLRVLDLRNTPLSMEAEYRPYSLYLLPSLKVLDGVEPRQEEKEEIKQVFAGRLTRELLEQIIGKQLPCLEGCDGS